MTPPKLGIKIVLWKHLDPDQSQALKDALTLQNVKVILAEIFNLTNVEDLREAILLSLYTYTLQYARDEDFTIEKLSAYFSIVKDSHEYCTETSFMNLDETFAFFKDLLLCHSVYCPPHSAELFTLNEVRKMSFHMINTYFRHFKLYKYAFTPQVQLDLVLDYIGEPESMTDLVDPRISETKGSQVTDECIDKENELVKITEKEEAKKYLRKIIINVLQEKIREIKLSVKEKLKQSEEMVNNKLGSAGYRDDRKKSLKMNKHHRK
ncbi:coiled-coil domain-containing protein 189-like isoform X2 [Octopus sinensis]|uniref:Coiled-coil domain-containing protein 189-like isoform X2 n=1 Tax=Octopus sinensis TaxID=2607531 RepID=A0A7E6F5G1_9MOLL|nr:coiled-coil domain-containing protein 189-like isoform X2 [Octopus sinensis]